MENTQTAPVAEQSRISIIDTLRGIALLGILMMNIPYFGNPYQYHFNINVLQEFSGPNYWCWYLVNLFFEGTMRGIFSMLFGAGALLLLDRLEKNPPPGLNPADIYYRRLLWLLLFGLFNAFILLWAGDILYTYAIVGLVLFPFRKVKASRLLILGIACMLLSTWQNSSKLWHAKETRKDGEAAKSLVSKHKKLTDSQKEDLEAWEKYQKKHSLANVRMEATHELKKSSQSYPEIFSEMAEVNVYIETKDFYGEYFFDALSFFFIGMALFRLGFLTGVQSLNVYWITMLLGYGIGLTINYFNLRTFIITGFDFSLYADYYPFSIYQFKRIFLALGHISLVILLYRYQIGNFLWRWLGNVGRMAFSNYMMQSIFGALFFHGFGLGYFGKLQRYELYEYVVCVWIFQLIFSQIWLHYFRFGPLEWVWRSLTYWKKQPFLRS